MPSCAMLMRPGSFFQKISLLLVTKPTNGAMYPHLVHLCGHVSQDVEQKPSVCKPPPPQIGEGIPTNRRNKSASPFLTKTACHWSQSTRNSVACPPMTFLLVVAHLNRLETHYISEFLKKKLSSVGIEQLGWHMGAFLHSAITFFLVLTKMSWRSPLTSQYSR